MNCTRPLDALDLEAITSGEEAAGRPRRPGHAGSCERLRPAPRGFPGAGNGWPDLPDPEVPETLPTESSAAGDSRLASGHDQSRKGPAGLFGALLGGSGVLLSMPAFGGSEQAGLLAAVALGGDRQRRGPLSGPRAPRHRERVVRIPSPRPGVRGVLDPFDAPGRVRGFAPLGASYPPQVKRLAAAAVLRRHPAASARQRQFGPAHGRGFRSPSPGG